VRETIKERETINEGRDNGKEKDVQNNSGVWGDVFGDFC